MSTLLYVHRREGLRSISRHPHSLIFSAILIVLIFVVLVA